MVITLNKLNYELYESPKFVFIKNVYHYYRIIEFTDVNEMRLLGAQVVVSL